MGKTHRVICRNKNCQYSVKLREDDGVWGTYRMHKFEEGLLNGEIKNELARKRIEGGAEIHVNGIYLCPACKIFLNDEVYYLKENITISPFGTVRYDVCFPFGEPKCPACGTKGIVFIKNIRSGNVKCPKCGGDLKVYSGFVD